MTVTTDLRTGMQVRKRNGDDEPVDVNKIVRAVDRCSDDLSEVDPMRVATRTISGLRLPASRTVKVRAADGTRLHTEVFGPEDGYPIVLAHGITCAIPVWHEQINDLARDYRVIAYDHRGHGRSGLPHRSAYSLGHLAGAEGRDACLPRGLVTGLAERRQPREVGRERRLDRALDGVRGGREPARGEM